MENEKPRQFIQGYALTFLKVYVTIIFVRMRFELQSKVVLI